MTYKRMMLLMGATAAVLAGVDAWIILSGNMDLGRHIPGLPSLDCVFWMYIVREARRRGFLDPPPG